MSETEEVWISPRKAQYIANREAFMAYLLERDQGSSITEPDEKSS